MDFTSTDSLDGDVIERAFTLGDIPGILDALHSERRRAGAADPARASG